MKTSLKKARGLGAAKEGSGHWLAQRVTAIFMIPLFIWFVVSVIKIANGELGVINSWVNVILLSTLIPVAIYHSVLGLQVVVEDYVSCNYKKYALLFLIKFTALVTSIAVIFSLISYNIKLSWVEVAQANLVQIFI